MTASIPCTMAVKMGAAVNKRPKYLGCRYLTKSIDRCLGGRGIACSYYIQGVYTYYAVRYEEDTGGNEEEHKVDTSRGKKGYKIIFFSERTTNNKLLKIYKICV